MHASQGDASRRWLQVAKFAERGGFDTRLFMRDQGLGEPIRVLWLLTSQVAYSSSVPGTAVWQSGCTNDAQLTASIIRIHQPASTFALTNSKRCVWTHGVMWSLAAVQGSTTISGGAATTDGTISIAHPGVGDLSVA